MYSMVAAKNPVSTGFSTIGVLTISCPFGCYMSKVLYFIQLYNVCSNVQLIPLVKRLNKIFISHINSINVAIGIF